MVGQRSVKVTTLCLQVTVQGWTLNVEPFPSNVDQGTTGWEVHPDPTLLATEIVFVQCSVCAVIVLVQALQSLVNTGVLQHPRVVCQPHSTLPCCIFWRKNVDTNVTTPKLVPQEEQ